METVLRNIKRMSNKAEEQKVRFRPHFKTHQSSTIGELFRSEGVEEITVSSVEMAEYFAGSGWNDVTIAFPVNLRQIDKISRLAAAIQLGVLVETPGAVSTLGRFVQAPLNLWIEVDTGYGRTGLPWSETGQAVEILQAIALYPQLRIRGLLTHAGDTYHSNSLAEICTRYRDSVGRINKLRSSLEKSTGIKLEVSVGDTPGCTVCPDLGKVNEIRPGNFIFYDAIQLQLGVCQADDIAVAVACPVVAVYPTRNNIVIYGGAVHLSKDSFIEGGIRKFGYVSLPEEDGWGHPLKGAFVSGLSQEHGTIHLESEDLQKIKPGDLVCILPAHSCLTVQVLGSYLTLDGNNINSINSTVK